MKSISASIVVLSGMLCLALGAMIPHNDTQRFICGVGLIVAGFGLVVWFKLLTWEPNISRADRPRDKD